ncbi:Aste57867_4701 [Aphanomyces stellatus]|uniref:RING-type E3 ubiquitin transferase n=1 Tax=Aphanomyces stellatus TaxID=120398 RepID=A0A485KC70_9STRA|nr:hypothetical protein As57867_004688 [Aphanomyces stellatus]VFT81801.1 Aste57867_4701 [Aphanomyces stellatus]
MDASLIQSAEDDLKQVSVHASAKRMLCGSNPFTMYTLIVSCVATKTWWIIQRRYRQFFALKKQLLKLQTQAKAKAALVELHTLLAPLFAIAFPKKSLRLDTDAMVAERQEAFNNITTTLMQLRAACVVALLRPDINEILAWELTALVDLLAVFLDVPARQKDEEHHRLSSPEHDVACCHVSDDDDDEMCSICLLTRSRVQSRCVHFAVVDEEESESVLSLTCGHSFHESCVAKWLETNMVCPMCREPATGGVVH